MFMKKKIVNGAIILTISGFLCKLFGAFYRIPLASILGAEGLGIYQMIFTVYSLALVIAGGAIPTSMSITIAGMRAKERGDVRKVFRKYFLISFCFGLLFFLTFIIFSKQIAALQGNSLAARGYFFISFAVLFSSLLAPLRGLFQGYENMTPTAVSQVIEQLTKLVLGLTLAFLFAKWGMDGVIGAILGVVLSELFGLIYLSIRAGVFSKQINAFDGREVKIGKEYALILLYVLLIPLVNAVDSFLVVNLLKRNFSPEMATSLFGIQSGMVNSLINFPIIFSLALSVSLLPSLTYFASKEKKSEVKKKINDCLNLVWLIILPCILAFIVLAPVIMQIAYPNLSPEMQKISVQLLQFSSIQMLFVSLLQITSSILQASKKSKFLIGNLVVSASIKIAITAIFVSTIKFNIFGLVISNITFYFLASISNLIYVAKIYHLKLNFKNFFVPIALILIMSIPCLIVENLGINFVLKIPLLGVLGIILYIIPIIYLKIFNINSVKAKK